MGAEHSRRQKVADDVAHPDQEGRMDRGNRKSRGTQKWERVPPVKMMRWGTREEASRRVLRDKAKVQSPRALFGAAAAAWQNRP